MLELKSRGPQLKLDSRAAYFTVPTLHQLAAQYSRIAGFDIQPMLSGKVSFDLWDPQYLDPTGNNHGMHTMDALRCLVDVHRTQVLLSGIEETVTAQRRLGKNKVVAIDAGTGTGILSLGLVEAGCDEVYALEINEQTAATTQKFVAQLGLADRVHVINCDATQITGLPQADILVSENLSNGLFDEPQYEIIGHLSEFLRPDAGIVPFKAECFVSLGKGLWETVDGEYVSMRELPDLVRYPGQSQYFQVDSRVGIKLSNIQGETSIHMEDPNMPINTLIVSTRFQINEQGEPVFLEADSAQFLGQSSAYAIRQGVNTIDGQVPVKISYPPGIRSRHLKTTVEDNQLLLQPI